MISSPVVKILSLKESSEAFYAVSGSKILKITGENCEIIICATHPEGKKWTSVSALSEDEKIFGVCDCEKNLFLYEISESIFTPMSVPMHLAKTATSVKFTDFPSKTTILVADKFGDVLRFQLGEEFDRWARESQKNSKSLSIHSKFQGKRPSSEVNEDVEDVEEDSETTGAGSEAHHCTIIGHISMVTDLQVLPIEGSPKAVGLGGLIVTCDRDEKVRLTRADEPERIHSFGLIHREFIGTLATCPKTRRVYSAGGDNFVAEWQVDGADCEKLILRSKIELGKDGVTVQEIKINSDGSELLVHVDKFGLFCYTVSENGNWQLKEALEASNITAFDFNDKVGYLVAFWSCESGVSFSKNISVSSFDQITVEAGDEIVDLLSKAKLRKDIERMDWKQKKHSNQKPRE